MLFTENDIQIIINKDFYEALKPHLQDVFRLKDDIDHSKTPENVFPKKCSKCGNVYHSPEDFYNNTVGIDGHDYDVCYSIGDQTRIFRYRNCPPPCNSTLVVASQERRDTSDNGLARRQCFATIHQVLRETLPHVSSGACHSITLYLIRSVTYENLSPLEAYLFLKNDVKEKRFLGFAEEPEIIVESLVG